MVDEIYISRQAIGDAEVKRLSEEGVLPAEKKSIEKDVFDGDIWDNIIMGFFIATLCLVGLLIGVIVFFIVRKYRKRYLAVSYTHLDVYKRQV